MKNLPIEFLNRMKTLPGVDFDAFTGAYERPPVRALHANLLKISADRLEEVLPKCGIGGAERIGFAADGFYFDSERIGTNPLHHAGAFYVQEPSAMMPVSMLNGLKLPENTRILDLCAAPGGKTSQAANLIKNKGFIVSNEIIPKRAKILVSNAERLGIRNCVVTNLDSGTLAGLLPSVFDVVIVDAPCSGEGMMRKDDVAIQEWSVENVLFCAERQRAILADAVKNVAPGGYLLYSTCTFSKEENEDNLEWFLERYPHFSCVEPPEEIKKVTAPGIGGFTAARRFYPHLSKGEGQFAVLLKNDSDGERGRFAAFAGEKLSKEDEKTAREFVSDMLGDRGEELSIRLSGGRLIMTQGELPLLPKSILCGVPLGTVEKGRLEPHHGFFSAYGADFLNKTELDEKQANAYIRGLTFECRDFFGFGAVLYRGCALGGVKISDSVAKNRYPKGLRAL